MAALLHDAWDCESLSYKSHTRVEGESYRDVINGFDAD